mgnify:CR=1 FL=1
MITHDIVITTFNSYKYIDNIYRFVFNNIQNYSKIIIVDDCSEKKFVSHLKTRLISFSNIIFFENKYNLGPSASRNLGIKLSNSNYVSFYDPDDYVFKERFEIIDFYINKFKPKVLFHDYTTKKTKVDLNGIHKIHNGFLYLFKSLYVTPAFTCKRDLLEKVGGYNENIRYAEDLDLYIRLKESNNFLFINQKLVKISSKEERIKDNSHLSSNIFLMRKSINKILFSKVYPIRINSIFFVFALLFNILKSLID